MAIHVVIRRQAKEEDNKSVHILYRDVSRSHRASDVPLISQMPGMQGFSPHAGSATSAK